MILKGHSEEWDECEAIVEKYLNEHLTIGWKSSIGPLELTNPTTDEFCSIYVADDEDFEPHSSDYIVLNGLDNWLEFGLFVENRNERLHIREQVKDIKYHIVIISKSHKKLVLLNKAYIWYCSDSGCILRYARRSDVVDLQEER